MHVTTSTPVDATVWPLPPAGACDFWNGTTRRYCCATEGVRLFLTGPRCPAHTPAAVAALHKEGTNQ